MVHDTGDGVGVCGVCVVVVVVGVYGGVYQKLHSLKTTYTHTHRHTRTPPHAHTHPLLGRHHHMRLVCNNAIVVRAVNARVDLEHSAEHFCVRAKVGFDRR